jgi:cell pole-organizing protein PopZ
MASGTFKTGKYSRVLPRRMSAAYEASQNDETLLALTNEIHLLDARLADLLAKVDSGESGTVWQRLTAANAELNRARTANDNDQIVATIREIQGLISRGSHDSAAWAAVERVVQQRRRLVESERKRAVELGTVMTSQQAMMAFSRLFQVIKANVHDRAVLQLITNVFYELDAESRGAPASNPERYDA